MSSHIPHWDPVESLPPELALVCLQEALPSGSDYPGALIELTSVSSKWQAFLFSASLLWSKIHVRYSSHDLMAIIDFFLHLSAEAPLDLIVWNTLGPEWEDIRLLLLPHIQRIHGLTLGDDPPIYYESPYAGAAYMSLASGIFDSLDRLPGLIHLDFGRTLHIDPSQLKTLDLPSGIRVGNTIDVYLRNIGHPNRFLSLFGGRETHLFQFGPGGLILQPDRPSGKQVVFSSSIYLRPTDYAISSLNSVTSFLVEILGLLNNPENSNRVSSSSLNMTFINTSNYMCYLCNKYHRSLLTALGCVRSHFGLRPFRCPGCGTCNARKGYARFYTSYQLLNHIGPTTCVECGTQQTGLWKQDDAGDPICSACPTPKLLPRLEHINVVHTPGNQARIRRLSIREQAIVLTDGGNTVESQLRVLDAIELYSPDSNNRRVWAEVPMLLPSGRETIEYNCKAPGCDYREVKFQKARQHFVFHHVAEACWRCPIYECMHIGKYKRLDDLKNHHMVPYHGIDYTRNRKRDAPTHPNQRLYGRTRDFQPDQSIFTSSLRPYSGHPESAPR